MTTNYEKMFGSPELAAMTIMELTNDFMDASDCCPFVEGFNCTCGFDFDEFERLVGTDEYDEYLDEMDENCYQMFVAYLTAEAE